MTIASHTTAVRTPATNLWAVVLDESRHPDRYQNEVVLMSMSDADNRGLQRTTIRGRTRVNEMISVNEDALMIEQSLAWPDQPPITLIIQLVPSGQETLLNLALNLPPAEEQDLTIGSLPDLIILATRLKETAEAL